MKLSNWMKIPEAARHMGMSRQGALKRLKRLNPRVDGRLLHRDGTNWLVSLVAFQELFRAHEQDIAISKLEGRVGDLELKFVALRNSHNAHRRRTSRKFQEIQTKLF